MGEVARLLDAIHHGDAQAAAELLPQVYDELRRLNANSTMIPATWSVYNKS